MMKQYKILSDTLYHIWEFPESIRENTTVNFRTNVLQKNLSMRLEILFSKTDKYDLQKCIKSEIYK